MYTTRQKWPALLALIVPLVLVFATETTPPPPGGVDLDAYCRNHGYAKAKNVEPYTAHSWACVDEEGNPRTGLDMYDVCWWQYEGELPYPVASDLNDPYSWTCNAVPTATSSGLDVAGYCRSVGFADATFLTPYDAYSWVCIDGDRQMSVDMGSVCHWQHGDSLPYAVVENAEDAYSWRCIDTPPIPGGMDVAGYCRSIGYGGASNDPTNAYSWVCIDSYHQADVDMAAVCQWQYGDQLPYPAAGNLYDANSWRCHSEQPIVSEGLDIRRYCQANGYADAAYNPDDAYSWRCIINEYEVGINVYAACDWQYKGLLPYPGLKDYHDVYGWTCNNFPAYVDSPWGGEPTDEPQSPTPPPAGADCQHVVAPGETLYEIGQLYGIHYLDLAAYNGIVNPNLIEVRQVLLIPAAYCPVDGS